MNEKIIIGLACRSGAGKSSAARYFQTKFEERSDEVYILKTSDFLARALNLFVESNKQDQQWLAQILIEKYGPNIISDALFKEIDGRKNGVFLIDSVRTRANAAEVKKRGGLIVFITASEKTRWERMKKRKERADDDVSFEKFQEIDNAPIEREIDGIQAVADFTVDNEGDLENTRKQLAAIFEKITEKKAKL